MNKCVKIGLFVVMAAAYLMVASQATPLENAISSLPDGSGTTDIKGVKCVTITILSPPSGGVYNTLPTLTVHFLDIAAGIDRGYYQIDGCAGPSWTELWSYNSSSTDTTIYWTIPSLTPGVHSVHFKALDDAGKANPDTCTNIWSLTYDPVRPTVEVASPASGGIYRALPSLALNFHDNLGLNRVYYQIDNCTGTWTELWSYNSGALDTSISWPVPSVPEGSHTIHFKVLDDAGNVNDDTCSYSWAFMYDFSSPTLSVSSPSSGAFFSSMPELTIDFHDNEGLDRAFYQIGSCSGYWSEFWSYNSSRSDTTISWTVPSLPLGTYKIYLKVTDDATNSNGDTCSYYWEFIYGTMIELSPPTRLTKCTGYDTCWIVGDDKATDVKAAFFRVGFDEDFVTPVEVIKGSGLIPPENYIMYNNIFPDSVLINLAALSGHYDGPGTFVGIVFSFKQEATATLLSIDSTILRDLSNNDIPSMVTGATRQIDCSPPTVIVTSPTTGGDYSALPTLTIQLHDNIGLYQAYYQIDNCGGSWFPLWLYDSNAEDTTIAWTVPGVSEGSHTIYFKVKDDAGNPNADSCTYFWSFTFSQPGISISPDYQMGKCGDVDTIYLYANDRTKDMKAAFFRIGYDHNYVTPLEVILGDLTPSSNYLLYPYLYTDSVLVNLAALSGGIDGPRRLIGIIFRSSQQVLSTPIEIDSCILRDIYNQDMSHSVQNAIIGIDCTPPNIEILSPPSGGSYDILPTLTLRCRDDLGLERGYYQIDGCTGPWHELWGYGSHSSDTTISWQIPGLAIGFHRIYFKVSDDAENINPDTCLKDWSLSYYGGCDCKPGDADNSGSFNILDVSYLVSYLYKGGPEPAPYLTCSGDADLNCNINILDVSYIISYLYRGGPAPGGCAEWVDKCGGPLHRKGM